MTQPAPNAAPPAGGTPPANPAGGTPPTRIPPADPAGATPPGTPPADPAGATPPAEDQPLGPAGLKALQAERDARKKLEDELAGLAPLKRLADAMKPEAGASDAKSGVDALTERLTKHEQDLASEREARYRAEVANEKGLTPDEAARLRGTTKEELAADADQLLAVFAARQSAGGAGGSRGPAPDPSQGARGSNAAADTEARIKEAQAKGDWRTVMQLQNQKLQKLHGKTT